MTDAIRAAGLRFGYGPVPIFDDAALHVERGSICVVTGANGSGKSTLLKLIVGLHSPEAGSVVVLGEAPGTARALRRIGYAPQGVGSAMVLPVSVSEVVAAGVTSRKPLLQPFGRLDWKRVNDALDAVGLDDLSRECVFELSGGQQQRALLARALVGDPELILLDEPTTGIDRAFRTVLLAELRRRADAGAAVVAVSHDPEDFHDIVDRILELEDGKIRALSHEEFQEVTGR